MMSVLQNAFANSSSSLIQSKITGNIVFILLAPISYLEFFCAYVAASVARGLAVGACVLAVTAWFVELRLEAPLWAAGVRAARRGARSARSACSPASSRRRSTSSPRSRTSSSCRSPCCRACSTRSTRCRAFWRELSHANPFFYMIDGFRYGFFGAADVAPGVSLALVARRFRRGGVGCAFCCSNPDTN